MLKHFRPSLCFEKVQYTGVKFRRKRKALDKTIVKKGKMPFYGIHVKRLHLPLFFLYILRAAELSKKPQYTQHENKTFF